MKIDMVILEFIGKWKFQEKNEEQQSYKTYIIRNQVYYKTTMINAINKH